MSAVTTEPIVREVLIQASPEILFDYFTVPEKMTRWLCESALSDPRPGGVLEQTHVGKRSDREGRRFHMHGEFVEVDYPTRLVFRWGWEEEDLGTPPRSSTVEVTLEALATGDTRLRLTHSGLGEASRADHDGGWTILLEDLVKIAA